MYDGDGLLLTRTVVNADGQPLLVTRADGTSERFYRLREANGTLRAAWVSWRHGAEAPGVRIIDERFDDDGRLVWRDTQHSHDQYAWEYDEQGRLVRAYSQRKGESTYGYADDGRLLLREYEDWSEVPMHGRDSYAWRGDQLIEESHSDTWSDSSGVVWSQHHARGLPQRGDGSWQYSNGDSGTWTEDWGYDAEGRPIAYSRRRDTDAGPARHHAWAWAGDRIVLHEVHEVLDGAREVIGREEWAWDDQGRLLSHDDGVRVRTWAWDESDGDPASVSDGDQTWTYEGDCPLTLFPDLLPADPTPTPLPAMPEPPRPYPG